MTEATDSHNYPRPPSAGIQPTYASGTPRPWRPLTPQERSEFNATIAATIPRA
jgi:hypothetical protein